MKDLLNEYRISNSVLCFLGAFLLAGFAFAFSNFETMQQQACSRYRAQLKEYAQNHEIQVHVGDFLRDYTLKFTKPFFYSEDCVVTWGLIHDNSEFDRSNVVSAHYGKEYKHYSKDILGRDYKEIAASFIKRIELFYSKHLTYATGPKRFELLGLWAKQWKFSHDNVFFDFNEHLLYLKPERGFSFKAKDINGRWRILSSSSGWHFIYNLKKDKWYIKSQKAIDEVRFDTFKKIRNADA